MPSSAKIDTKPIEDLIYERTNVRSQAGMGSWESGSFSRRFINLGRFNFSKYRRIYFETVTKVMETTGTTAYAIFAQNIGGVFYINHQISIDSTLVNQVPALYTHDLGPESGVTVTSLPVSSVSGDIELIYPNIRRVVRATEGHSKMVLRDDTAVILMMVGTPASNYVFDLKIRGVF